MSRVAPNRIDRPGTAEEAWDEWAGLKHLSAAHSLDWPSVMIVVAHPDDEVLGAGGVMAMLAAAARRARRAGLEMLSYPIWMWHWARPGDCRVPWPQACQVALTVDVAAKKKAAIGAFASQLTGREGAAGPVLPPGIVAHFTRPLEVLLR